MEDLEQSSLEEKVDIGNLVLFPLDLFVNKETEEANFRIKDEPSEIETNDDISENYDIKKETIELPVDEYEKLSTTELEKLSIPELEKLLTIEEKLLTIDQEKLSAASFQNNKIDITNDTNEQSMVNMERKELGMENEKGKNVVSKDLILETEDTNSIDICDNFVDPF